MIERDPPSDQRGAVSLEFAVLPTLNEIDEATRDLRDRGLVKPPVKGGPARRLARRLVRRSGPPSILKTWDVRRALDAIGSRFDRTDPVLDMGCYACDVLPALKRLGYESLFGIDLNPAVRRMPYARSIHYIVGDLLSTPWPDAHFSAITAISVIEHGVPDGQLCREVSRLLRPGGVFIFTTDYWPQKIVTTKRLFGLDWRIFDEAEIGDLIATASTHNLHPVSDPGPAIRYSGEPPIHYEGKDYTFLYGGFIRGG